jgi:osmotically-inducible protein OsmY
MATVGQKVKEEIRERLRWDARLEAANIEVTVCEGNVRLPRKALSERERTIAQINAVSFVGVKSIHSDIQTDH